MVSLIDKLAARANHVDKPKVDKFIQLIEGSSNVETGEPGNNTDKVYFLLVTALSKNEQSTFEKVYSDFSKRRPSKDSPWLSDNFMVLVLILGISRYNIDQEWISQVLSQRDGQNQYFQAINQTFKSLLTYNYQNTDNVTEIVIVFLDFLNRPQLPHAILNETFQKLSTNPKLLQNRDDFLIVLSLRAHDVIVLTKDTPDAIEAANLKTFKALFLKRIDITRNVIYGLILLMILYFALKYYRNYEGIKDYVNDLGAIFQVGGFALLAGFQWVRKKLRIALLALFGYQKVFK